MFALHRVAARHRAAVTAGALVVGVLTPWAGAAADTPPPGFATFTASASAAPFALELIDSGAPVIPGGQVLYATPTFSRAELDSVGSSTGFASAPFPGDAIPALMGTANGASPTGPVFPAYPFSVTSRFPGEPEATQAHGPQTLKATSSENSSDGDAHVGLARSNPGLASVSSTSGVKLDRATGEVIAEATGVIDGLALESNVVINHIAGHARISARPGQTFVKETSFSVGTMTVGGQTVGFTDKGFVPADGSKPGPDIGALSKQLADAGITFAFVPSRETDNSIDSAGLAIGYTRAVPNVGDIKVTLTLGRVTAKVEALSETPLPAVESIEDSSSDQATESASTPAQTSNSQPTAEAEPESPTANVSSASSSPYSYAPLSASAGTAPSSGSLDEPVPVAGGPEWAEANGPDIGVGTAMQEPQGRTTRPATPLLATPVRASRARTGGLYLALCGAALIVVAGAGLLGRSRRVLE